MATPGFQMLFENLQSIGFFEFALPLLLFMAISYGLLRKTEAVSEDPTVDAVVSIVFGFLATFGIFLFIPFSFVTQFFGVLSVLIIVVLGLLILLGLFGVEFSGEEVEGRTQRLAIIGVIIISLIVLFPFLRGFGGGVVLTDQSANFLLTLALIGVLGYIISSVAREGE